jgi:hypothetical protein
VWVALRSPRLVCAPLVRCTYGELLLSWDVLETAQLKPMTELARKFARYLPRDDKYVKCCHLFARAQFNSISCLMFLLEYFLAYFLSVKMEVKRSSERSAFSEILGVSTQKIVLFLCKWSVSH